MDVQHEAIEVDSLFARGLHTGVKHVHEHGLPGAWDGGGRTPIDRESSFPHQKHYHPIFKMTYQHLHIYRSLWEGVIVMPAPALGAKRKKIQNQFTC